MGQLQEIFFDLETKHWSDEVEGGWSNIAAFGLSVAVTCWNDSATFQTWLEDDASKLVKELERADRIIGFSIIGFDYEVLRAYVPALHTLLDNKSFDILADVRSRLGFRVSLDSICTATLNKSKSGSGYDALRWFRQGEIEKVVRYCQMDVGLTRDIYRYGQAHGFISYCYPDMEQPEKVHVDW